jgi:uncharacterized protein YggE
MLGLLRSYGKFSVFFVVLFVVIFSAPVCILGQFNSNREDKTITVYGKAEMSVKPDVVYFPMDISTTAPIIDDAYSENRVKIKNTVEKLKKLGIRDEWIEVLDAQLYKVQSYNVGETTIFGVSNIVVATIHDIDKIKTEDLRKKIFGISQAVSRTTVTPYAGGTSPGASVINGELSRSIGSYYGNPPVAVFGLTEYKKYQNKMLKEAIEDAQKKAEKLAKALGVNLKSIKYFYQSYPYNSSCSTTGQQKDILPQGPKSPEPESVKLCTTVNVSYSFE